MNKEANHTEIGFMNCKNFVFQLPASACIIVTARKINAPVPSWEKMNHGKYYHSFIKQRWQVYLPILFYTRLPFFDSMVI